APPLQPAELPCCRRLARAHPTWLPEFSTNRHAEPTLTGGYADSRAAVHRVGHAREGADQESISWQCAEAIGWHPCHPSGHAIGVVLARRSGSAADSQLIG